MIAEAAKQTDYRPKIGLEIHAQLATKSKMFCGCSVDFGADPNTHVCPVCMGLPGALPVVNRHAVELAIRLVLAVGGQIRENSLFARKNYFYPDLPKGYQISQYEYPLGLGGLIRYVFDGQERRINLTRVHLEEDAGKLVHESSAGAGSLIDFNRCGVPLVEIVSEPELLSPVDAKAFLQKIRQILNFLGVCRGGMEEGAFRCDANISLIPDKSEDSGIRTEIKNINSFRGVERALTAEIDRQRTVMQSGGSVEIETLNWNDHQQILESMRAKEESPDYRYFPEPDLPPLQIDPSWIEQLKANLPELPDAIRERLISQHNLSAYDAEILTSSRALTDYYEELLAYNCDAQKAAHWIANELLSFIDIRSLSPESTRIPPKECASLLKLVNQGAISRTAAKQVFATMWETGKSAESVVAEMGIEQISNPAQIAPVVEDILKRHPDEVEEYHAGKRKLLGFFVGQVMKHFKGRANPQVVNRLIREKLDF